MLLRFPCGLEVRWESAVAWGFQRGCVGILCRKSCTTLHYDSIGIVQALFTLAQIVPIA